MNLLNMFTKVSKKYIIFYIILILVGLFFIKNVDIAILFFISIVFACFFNRFVNKLSTKMSRSTATILVLSLSILIFLLFLIPILYLGVAQISSFATNFPSYILHLSSKLPVIKHFDIASIKTSEIINSLALSSENIIARFSEFMESIGSAVLYIFTGIIFIYFLLVDKDRIKKSCLDFFPQEIQPRTNEILSSLGEKLGGYLLAQLVVSGSVWVMMTIGLLLFHIDYAIVLGLVCGVLSLIPVVGSALSLIIALVATYESGWVTLLIITVLFTLSHFVENHVVRPYVYSKFMDLHPIIIFTSLIVGGKYLGVLGVLFAPPLAMILFILLDELYLKSNKKS